MNQLISQIANDPLSALMVIANLVIIESLLSVDNAAVLATMVMELPAKDRKKALSYGIIGAYFFRGLCLIFAAFIIKIWWLKPLGGIYLIYLVWQWRKEKREKKKNLETTGKKHKHNSKLSRFVNSKTGNFWATIILVELMDLAFSIDNIFAAVAFSSNILIILCGVFIGILAMRFVAQAFVNLMQRFLFLETCAFIVIGILGVKLMLSLYTHFVPESALSHFLESHTADVLTSALTISVFVIPVAFHLLLRTRR